MGMATNTFAGWVNRLGRIWTGKSTRGVNTEKRCTDFAAGNRQELLQINLNSWGGLLLFVIAPLRRRILMSFDVSDPIWRSCIQRVGWFQQVRLTSQKSSFFFFPDIYYYGDDVRSANSLRRIRTSTKNYYQKRPSPNSNRYSALSTHKSPLLLRWIM